MLLRSTKLGHRLLHISVVTAFAIVTMAGNAHASTLSTHDHGADAPTVHAYPYLGPTPGTAYPTMAPRIEQTVSWNLPLTWSGKLDAAGNPRSDDPTIWNQTLANGRECGGWWQVDVYWATKTAIDAVLADSILYPGEDWPILKTGSSWRFEKQPLCSTPKPTPTPTAVVLPTATPTAKPTATPIAVALPTATPTAKPTATPIAVVLPTATPAPKPSHTQVAVLGELIARANQAVLVETGWADPGTAPAAEKSSTAPQIALVILLLALGAALAVRARNRLHGRA